ncbi:MAG: putative toxin-antitoxin system toxin component, PIN family [Candidatus Nanoarchaeia archaeon]|nr:putative toxin-antitoxin system toxin component, PIN family [Candidatus Nanoarchaeia archaeon]
MRVVLDTNIWLSAIFWSGEANKLINIIKTKKIDLIITKKILLEIIDVLNKESKFQKFIEDRNMAVKDLIRTILSISEMVISNSELDIIKEHISDNKILESTIDGKVNYLISYDNHLLKLKEYKNIKIIKPEEFLELV